MSPVAITRSSPAAVCEPACAKQPRLALQAFGIHRGIGRAFSQVQRPLQASQTWQTRGRASRVEVLVLDTGAGIKAALLPLLPLLFTPYRRFDDRSRDTDSLGDAPGQDLGLALVMKQAELLGHPLRVRTQPGRGSVFALGLPVVQGWGHRLRLQRWPHEQTRFASLLCSSAAFRIA